MADHHDNKKNNKLRDLQITLRLGFKDILEIGIKQKSDLDFHKDNLEIFGIK